MTSLRTRCACRRYTLNFLVFKRGGFGSLMIAVGGWNMDGRGPSIWDTFCHNKGRVFEGHTGDVACNSYQLWDEDLKCIQQLGLTHYRLSISWSRLLPDGTTRFVNTQGVAYYNKVIDDLIRNAVIPMVTLNHFDLPQALQDRGGWKSPEIADVFDLYAQFCFKTFGDRVKFWITLNEPYVCAYLGYEKGLFAPGLKEPGTSVYLVGHNMLRAHARAWHSYNAHFRSLQGGKVSIALNSDWAEPLDPSCPEDVAAAQRYMDFKLGWFACPVFGTGDYPQSMRSRIETQSLELEFTEAQRLPKFLEDEPKPFGTADFFALNYYTSRKVKDASSRHTELSFTGDLGAEAIIDPSWPVCGVSWLAVMPEGLRKLLKYIKETCNNPDIYITENGFSQIGPVVLEDVDRCQFYRATLQQVSKAITDDGVNVRGYFSWSLLDNFEWSDGFSVRFGLFHVDFSSPRLKRTMYRSGKEYTALIKRYRNYNKQ
ncbi:Cytosolic beta-glucosidase [Bagarius yarrelli]|uniref:Cytosolic beta-glucosidase n=1 Tax=Bagarius yarrelli TaxID=175774 RepID=A0A556TYU3_BAGYA|nr:Cytosolic beta-glucosidase [Bagarius yarrelli]